MSGVVADTVQKIEGQGCARCSLAATAAMVTVAVTMARCIVDYKFVSRTAVSRAATTEWQKVWDGRRKERGENGGRVKEKEGWEKRERVAGSGRVEYTPELSRWKICMDSLRVEKKKKIRRSRTLAWMLTVMVREIASLYRRLSSEIFTSDSSLYFSSVYFCENLR